ncbi:type II toxin-antitoxin system PemK/MazF family toxin [[Limnothrix rosea] IAM M-220]|uniref:type II toxin-antitoxin system PemK/MazF family toxin n=1 Tax=[Limnothrix rosea] IAM M-220 TaxID=454133 RepID=UPI00095E21A5|nr:type II toxin-antitoxin system PemK/MazF family toxin [[Limnothrix rosea] IAM M-220]OKH15177.1 PemK family transcriptional regulator [[Limnothrix rosea] IAM M-220]
MQCRRGEIWLVNLDPTIGAEIRKTRPAVIVSSDAIGKLPIRLIAPITDWKPYFSGNLWHIQIEPNRINGLSKVSAIDTLQIRGIDTKRLVRKLGKVSDELMRKTTQAIALVIDYEEERGR